jgi:hypothetical protein
MGSPGKARTSASSSISLLVKTFPPVAAAMHIYQLTGQAFVMIARPATN